MLHATRGCEECIRISIRLITITITITGKVDEAVKITPQPYDLMTFTNLFMFTFAAIISSILAEFTSGIAHCAHNPQYSHYYQKDILCVEYRFQGPFCSSFECEYDKKKKLAIHEAHRGT
eukprot:scaffold786_cov315-Chaetoceros_neogracile.AAC.4